MGGKHCCVVGCNNSNEKTKHSTRVSYFGFPTEKEWRAKLIAAVNRSDRSFNPATAHICSAHFEEKCLLFHGKGFKLIPGSLPTLKMPKKSVETPCPPPRQPPTCRPSPPIPERVVYLSLSDVQRDVDKDMHGWSLLKSDSNIIVLGKYDATSGTISKTVTVNDKLNVAVRFGEVLVQNVEKSLEKFKLKKLLQQLDRMTKCEGHKILPEETLKCSAKVYRFVSTVFKDGKPVVESVVRSHQCLGGVDSNDSTKLVCSPCENVLKSTEYPSTESKVLHPNTPLSCLSREELIKEVKYSRGNSRKMQIHIQSITNQMTEAVANDVGEGLFDAIEKNPPDDSFLDLFWKQQKKALEHHPKGMRWHPMMIRFAIFLQYQSSRAYEAIRESSVLRLPNKSTLRDYTNVIRPTTGFQYHVFEELKKIADDLPQEKRFVALLHDEMKIKSRAVVLSYQENQIRIQRSLAFKFVPKGNTAGGAGGKRPIIVTNSPLKRSRHK